MKFWFDTEFIEDGRTIELISIGVVGEDGRRFYAENSCVDLRRANDWVIANVAPHLSGVTFVRGVPTFISGDAAMTPHQIRERLLEFVNDGVSKPAFWAYYGAYDWVALCQLFGRMIDLPKGWPMYVRDVKQLCDMLGNPELPGKPERAHNALDDAVWTRDAWKFLDAMCVGDITRPA